jgi:hypothetical protein
LTLVLVTAVAPQERILINMRLLTIANTSTRIAVYYGTTAAPIHLAYSSTKHCRNYYYNEYREALLRIAKGFFNNLLNQLVDKTVVAAVKEKLIGFKYNNTFAYCNLLG